MLTYPDYYGACFICSQLITCHLLITAIDQAMLLRAASLKWLTSIRASQGLGLSFWSSAWCNSAQYQLHPRDLRCCFPSPIPVSQPLRLWAERGFYAHAGHSIVPMEAKYRILSAAHDAYDGVLIDANLLPTTEEDFEDLLQRSVQVSTSKAQGVSAALQVFKSKQGFSQIVSPVWRLGCNRDCVQTWRQQARRGIWLRVPIDKAYLINIAVSAGFTFHHAEPDYLMLTLWLPDTESTLPPNASHQVCKPIQCAANAALLQKKQARCAGVLAVSETVLGGN